MELMKDLRDSERQEVRRVSAQALSAVSPLLEGKACIDSGLYDCDFVMKSCFYYVWIHQVLILLLVNSVGRRPTTPRCRSAVAGKHVISKLIYTLFNCLHVCGSVPRPCPTATKYAYCFAHYCRRECSRLHMTVAPRSFSSCLATAACSLARTHLSSD